MSVWPLTRFLCAGWSGRRRDAVIESYLERQIDAKIVVTAEDILQEYHDANWNRGLKFIYSARATKAAAVEDLAAEKSILSLPGYVLKGQVNEQVADELFALARGIHFPSFPSADQSGYSLCGF